MVKNKLIIGIIFLTALVGSSIFAQTQAELIKYNIFDVNRIATKFSNANELCDGNFISPVFAMPPAFEYPNGSGISYGTSVALVVGGFTTDGGGSNPNNLPYVDAAMREGPADYWDPLHYDPYPEFIFGDRAAMSDDMGSWPIDGLNQGWPEFYPNTNVPVEVGSEGWPGFGIGGERIADQESFSVCKAVDHLAEIPPERWLKIQTTMRGLAWKLSLYEDMIFWVFTVRNMGTAPIDSTIFGIWSDFSFIDQFLPPNIRSGDSDKDFFDRERQLSYGHDFDGFEESPFGGSLEDQDIAWAGTVFLKTPKGSNGKEMGLTSYDVYENSVAQATAASNGARKTEYYWFNMVNIDDPQDSDGDHFDDQFDNDGDGIFESDFFVGDLSAATMGSGPFVLKPGEVDTLIIATVFGNSEIDLLKNVDRAIDLYGKNFKVPKPPPEPIVKVVAGDRSAKLIWGRESEMDSTFEGYKIYRSTDGGASWGQAITNGLGSQEGFVSMATFDLVNGITGAHPDAPYLDRGIDSGLDDLREIIDGDTVNVFIDETVINGIEYWYAVTSYTAGDPSTPPIENARGTNPAVVGDNTVSLIPSSPIAKGTLDSIRVVPNPYIATSAFEREPNVREIQFTNLPAQCTIRIYTSSAEQVKVLHHTSGSFEQWNLRTVNEQEVAPGLYFYHIKSDIGEKTGKLVIIK